MDIQIIISTVCLPALLQCVFGALQGCLFSTHDTSIMWFVFSWLLHAPVCNCTCYWQTLMSRALLSCETLTCIVEQFICWHCPWRSNKQRKEAKLHLKALLPSRRITAAAVMKHITIIHFKGGCHGFEIEKSREAQHKVGRQRWNR